MRKTIEVTEEDHTWLKANRGSEPIKSLISKVIAKYKEVSHPSKE